MPKRLLDTSILISHWDALPKDRQRTGSVVREWARKLVEIHSTKLICTPVLIEILAGTRDQKELALHLEYLDESVLVDDRKIPPAVWEAAERLAKRVPSRTSSKARQLGDCLIRAIADHFHCEVLTLDGGLRRMR